jgi:NitT/TauT family transport system substrate-binding protein
MIAIDRGIPTKVTAANIREPNAVMVYDDLAEMWKEHGADAFDVWREERGRRFRFGTFPQGSTPYVFLRFWLRDVGVEPGEDVTITEVGGANALWQAIANEEVDGASILEPVLTRVEQEGSSMSLFRTAGEIMPGQPGAVVAMSDEVCGTETASSSWGSTSARPSL